MIPKPRISRIFQALGLTPRESEIMHWLSEGKSSVEIASILTISPRTVDKHAERSLEKPGVKSRAAGMALIQQL